MSVLLENAERLLEISKNISLLLSSDLEGEGESALIERLYGSRSSIISYLRSEFETEAGRRELDEENSPLKNKLKEIAKLEEKNLDLLNRRVKLKGAELAELTRKKSLFIYTKDNK
ncbi:MAG: hypothetical protein ACM3U1_06890 [Chloroflexota bacterium]